MRSPDGIEIVRKRVRRQAPVGSLGLEGLSVTVRSHFYCLIDSIAGFLLYVLRTMCS